MTRIAVYPGSFDPVTFGHLDILERATLIFDKVVLAVLENPTKAPLFSVEERVQLLKDTPTVGNNENVDVGTFNGLTVEYARKVGAIAVVRGLRALSDFEAEFQMALMNRRLQPDIHTVFLMTSFSNVFVSSSLIKEVCRFGGRIEEFVPPHVAHAMHAKLDMRPVAEAR